MTNEPDYSTMDCAGMLHAVGDDAQKWAAAFLQLNPNCGVEECVLFGWFANAIEHSHDTRTGRVHNGDHAQYLIDNDLTPGLGDADAQHRG